MTNSKKETTHQKAVRMTTEYKDTPLAKIHGTFENSVESFKKTLVANR